MSSQPPPDAPSPSTRARAPLAAVLRTASRSRSGVVLAFTGCAALGSLIWLLLSEGAARSTLANDLIHAALGLAATGLAWRASRHSGLDPRSRRAWGWIALGFGSYWIGDLVWTWNRLAYGHDVFPSAADAAFLTFYPLCLTGLLTFPGTFRSRSERIQFALDAAVVLGGGGLVVWHLLLRPVTGAPPLAQAVALALPTGDVLLLFAAAVLISRRSSRTDRGALLVLAAGLVLIVVGDLVLGYLSLRGQNARAGWPDSPWMAGRFLLILSPYLATRPTRRAGPATEGLSGERLVGLLPYLSIAICFGLLVAVTRDTRSASLAWLILAAAGLTALIVTRQVMSLRENARLFRQARSAEREARALYDAAVAIGQTVELEPRLQRVLDAAVNLLEAEHGYVAVADPSRRTYEVVAARGAAVKALGVRWPAGPGLVGETLASRRAVYAPRVETDFRASKDALSHGLGARSWLGVPIADEGAAIGVLALLAAETDAFTDAHRRLLASFAALAEGAMREARLNRRAQEERGERERTEMLRHLALHDSLTGLPNRTLLFDRLRQAMRPPRGTPPSLALLVLDLDRFKEVNDSLGHPVGDLLLQSASQRMREALRPSDTVARLGGDEFAVLLPEADEDAAVAAAQRLLSSLDEPFALREHQVRVGASVGIALHPRHGADPAGLLRLADVAMYIAKRQRRGHAVYSPSQDREGAARRSLAQELALALGSDQLVLHFQPIVEFGTGRLHGLEALVRWRHPERGLVPPEEFVPLAEEADLIDALTGWVLEAALAQCRAWDGRGLSVLMGVNLSMRNLRDPKLPRRVADSLEQHRLSPDRLLLEITESAVMADPVRAHETLARLREAGVRIALDDFGTGYSSLGYLKRLPVDVLKIDRTFVRDMLGDEKDATIVRAAIDLAHNLGLVVVAEGVEDSQTWGLLTSMGCDLGQGHHLTRALPAAEIQAWLGTGLPRRSIPSRKVEPQVAVSS